MAFKRSSVRSRSAPPPFALEFRERRVSPEALAKGDYLFLFALKLQSFGWRATFFPLEYVGMQRPSRAKVSPEASPEALAKGEALASGLRSRRRLLRRNRQGKQS